MAAAGAAIASVAYGIPQVLQVLHWLPAPLDRILIFAPSLALAPLFVAAVGAAAADAQGEARAWRFAALGWAAMYACFVSPVYAMQLGIVIPRELGGAPVLAGITCCGFQQPVTAIDLLGYTMMSLATLLLAPTFRGATLGWLALNGVLALPIFLQLWFPAFIWAASPWLVTFPVALALMARDLARAS